MADRVLWMHSGTISQEQKVAAPVETDDLTW
jgi:hypothetical protein